MRLIAAVLIVTALFSTVALADDDRPLRMITVTGKAERRVVPDEAHVMVNISALDNKLANAKSQHDQKLRKVMDIAKGAGVEESQVKTQSSGVQPEYSYDNNTRHFRGYRVSTVLDFTVKKVDAVGNLLETLATAGLENKADSQWMGLSSVNYGVSSPDKIRDEMTVEAIKNAQEKAARMAESAGASLGSVQQIQEGNTSMINFPSHPVPMMAKAARMESAADASIAPPPGEQEVSVNVTVSYELK